MTTITWKMEDGSEITADVKNGFDPIAHGLCREIGFPGNGNVGCSRR